MHEPTLVLDNGAHSIKATWSNSNAPPQVYRNAIIRSKTERRNYIADEFDQCQDFGGLTFRLAFERGILNNWDVEKQVWDRVYCSKGRGLSLDPTSTSLLITEPVFNLPNVKEHYDQMIFEEYEFSSYARVPGPSLLPHGPTARRHDSTSAIPECILAVDAGFSFTHVVPIFRGRIIEEAVRRIDAGGKLLTNHLKELVSFRQWYMMDQTSVMEHAKETCCYVTQEWEKDWAMSNSSSANDIIRTYVLPDFLPGSTNKLGYVRDANAPPPLPSAFPIVSEVAVPKTAVVPGGAPAPAEEQLMQLNNERFTVSEVLFNPTTIDLNQQGLPECIESSISLLPLPLQGLFWNNIVLVGGSTLFPGFGERLSTELRSLAPQETDVDVRRAEEPTLECVLAGANAVDRFREEDVFVTRKEYLESGTNATKRKFARFGDGGKAIKRECEGW